MFNVMWRFHQDFVRNRFRRFARADFSHSQISRSPAIGSVPPLPPLLVDGRARSEWRRGTIDVDCPYLLCTHMLSLNLDTVEPCGSRHAAVSRIRSWIFLLMAISVLLPCPLPRGVRARDKRRRDIGHAIYVRRRERSRAFLFKEPQKAGRRREPSYANV